MWLHRLAPTDVDAPWALTLAERCKRYNVLPGSGGAYDQDENVMTAMEHASGVNALFDADSRVTMQFIDIHTRLGEQAAAIIEAVNGREARQKAAGEQAAAAATVTGSEKKRKRGRKRTTTTTDTETPNG